ncbi:hypothetical protein [Salinibacter altiplanensis]|uniref:hypothetical protein n=1 Tax=Salinibacter altiplanensis TaxID=1803181 RepID=UPI000C9EF5D1|nr:hypothetical protein [Salinibacter altiplanensis]
MHNLHGPDRLFETRYGHVLQCECCGRIQITFREHTLLLEVEDLEALTDTVKHAFRQVRDAEGQDQWTLQAETDAGPVTITLTEPSVQALNDLLQGAWSMYVLRERVAAISPDEDGSPEDVLRDHLPLPESRQTDRNRFGSQ